MKTYRVSESKLSAPEGVVVIMDFGQGGFHEVLLEGAADYIRTTRGLVGRMPTGAWLTDRRKVGVFPCIIALSQKAADDLSAMMGYVIEVGDGVSCATQLQARTRAMVLRDKFRTNMAEIKCQWMVSPPAPSFEQASKPKAKAQQELDLSDSPF